MKKRGQVTLFIILGIIILIIASLLYFTKNQITAPLIPQEVAPVHNLITECLKDNAQDALFILGEQGGYINIPENILRDRRKHVIISSTYVKPLWYSLAGSSIPSEEEMTTQISNYIEEKLLKCLNNFSSLKNQYEIKQISEPKVTTVLGDKDVIITLNYKIDIRNIAKNKTTRLEKFTVTLPVRLKQIYYLARRIMEYENDKHFLENITINFMAMNPNIPFTNLEFYCGTKTWYLSNIKKELQEVLKYNIPYIRIKNTIYPPFLYSERVYERYRKIKMKESMDKEGKLTITFTNKPQGTIPEDLYYYNNMFFDLGIGKTKLAVAFRYDPSWDLKIYAKPSKNGLLKSSYMKGFTKYLRFLCLNFYHFTYDVVYPVEVNIRDDSAFNGKGYNFKFMFLVIIENNKANREGLTTFEFTTPTYDESFCNERGNTLYEIRAIDEYDGYELADVNISYLCIDTQCYLGKTDYDESKRTNNLITTLPLSCTNPFIIAKKKGYLETRKQITNDKNLIEIKMPKLKQLDVKVIKYQYSYEDNKRAEQGTELDDYDNVTIMITNPYYDEKLVYPLSEDLPKEMKKVNLIIKDDINYDLIIMFNRYNHFAGGYIGNFTFNQDEIANANEIIFKIVDFRPTPKNEKEEERMIQYLYLGDYKEKLKPELR